MRVTFVELSAYESILPLASGYLQAYALKDPDIAAACRFEIFSAPVTDDPDAIAGELIGRGSDVYAFSCYIWNIGLVRRVFERVYAGRPDARYILGGPQVMHHAEEYVPPDREHVLVCNGEGEKSFHEYLRAVLAGDGDYGQVPGVTYWRAGELVTTPAAERIRDLMDVPSPFTTGIFDGGGYTTAILETNRGCPFTCAFCYWGAATNSKVNKFEIERVKQDITWLCENDFVAIFIVDANWGMLSRDVELTEHLVECSKRYGYPVMVAMAAAKNKPDRMAEITELLVRGGLLTSQPISLQTLDPEALRLVQRQNIKPATYTELQRSLREKQISSYIELIWPLPGETLDTYRDGLTQLCRSRADTIIVYPELLLHNTPMFEKREEFGLQMRRVPSDVAEADIVVSTNWVTPEDYYQGVRLYYSMHALYNLRGLYYLANYLDRSGITSFGELFTAAAAAWEAHPEMEVSRFIVESTEQLRNYDYHNSGLLAHLVLHASRREFDEFLTGFARSQPWWADETARGCFELDLIARPYIYAETARVPDHRFEAISVTTGEGSTVTVEVPDAVAELLAELDLGDHERAPRRFRIHHTPDRKLAFMPQRSLEHNASYCQGMVLRLRDLLPLVEPMHPVPTPV